MRPKSSVNRYIRSVLLCCLLPLAVLPTQTAAGRSSHPEGLQSKWLNHQSSELVDAYGEPDQVLDTAVRGIVVYGDTPSIMYVYGSNPEFGGGCIAAYVIELETSVILQYQCR